MATYDISKLGSGYVAQVAQKIDKYSYEGQEGQLDGKEISLFIKELLNKGITFDFSKFNDSKYIQDVENQYKSSLEQAFSRNTRAQKIIEEHKNTYKFEQKYIQDMSGGFNSVYEITANKEIRLGALKDELDIPSGVISKSNDGYDQWDYNGSYIDNKPMKDVTIKVPASKLGANPDFSDKIKSLWNQISK